MVERLWEAFADAPHFETCPGQRRRHGHLHRDDVRDPRRHAARGDRQGRKVEWRQCHLYRFDDSGRAVEHDAIRDDVSLLRQFND